MIQGSEEWLAERAGKFTSSRAEDLMAQGKGGKPSTSRANLLALLAIERFTGCPVATYQNAAMRRGNALEQDALSAYAFAREVTIEKVAFVKHPTLRNVGCSPDALVGDDGIAEAKCPDAMAKHLAALRSGEHAREYRWQIQHLLLGTGRSWVDALSFDPRYPNNLQLAIKRVPRDEAAITALEAAIVAADAEVDAIVEEMRRMEAK